MADVFVSYNRDDLDFVQPFIRALRGAGLSVWWDHEMPPDAPWEETTERELTAAKTMIVVWSVRSVASDFVKSEARHARKQGKLIQVFFGPCEPPLFFGERQGVDLTGWKGNAADRRIETVISAVRAVMSDETPAAGVGWAPKVHRTPWRSIAAVTAFVAAAFSIIAAVFGEAIACRFEPMRGVCRLAEEPATTPAGERAVLLARLVGVWGNTAALGGDSCTTRVRYGIERRGEDDIVIISQDDHWESEGRVVSTEGRSVFTRTIKPEENAGQQWELRLESDRLVQVDHVNIATVLVRCAN